ncbi:MAG: transferrin receptor-like dimerization domain-containing protein, partial [Ferruginibacter sp.]
VLYINSDNNGRGFLGAGGSQALEPAFTEIIKEINDPEKNVSIYERSRSKDIIDAPSSKIKKEMLAKKTYALEALGSGSDFSPFAQHIGIPSMNLGFGGEDDGGEYHSIYDSYDLYRRFKDPTFEYGVLLAKTAGHTTLRFANAETLPFDFRNLQKTISKYATELVTLADEMRENTSVENQLIKEKYYTIADKVNEPLLAPVAKDEVPFISFASLQNALTALEKATNALSDSTNNIILTADKKLLLNEKLYRAEQALLTKEGLPRRGWYRHAIYAPGFYTGYGVKTLPGIREAIEQRNWKEAREQIEIAANTINNFSAYLDAITAGLR